MVKLVIGHCVGNAVTDGTAGHIQSLDAPVQQPDKLKPADTGILTGILSKALSLAQIVRSGAIMRFQNIKMCIRDRPYPAPDAVRPTALCLL